MEGAMQKLTVFLAFSITVLVGCSSTHNVQRDAAAEWVPEASERLMETGVTVTVRTGAEHEGEVVKLDENQIQLSNRILGTEVTLPMDSIVAIQSYSNAAWVLLASVAGGAMGGAYGSSPKRNGSEFGDRISGGIGGALLGSVCEL
jgi:hypothetical protein